MRGDGAETRYLTPPLSLEWITRMGMEVAKAIFIYENRDPRGLVTISTTKPDWWDQARNDLHERPVYT